MRNLRFGLAILIIAGTLATASSSTAQSLADVAKKTKDEQAKSTKPTKVLTNKDLETGRPAPAGSAAPATAGATTEATPATTTADKDATTIEKPVVKDEAWWRARMARLRIVLAEATTARGAAADLVTRLAIVRANVPELGFSVAQAYAAASSELAKAKAELDLRIAAENAAKLAIAAAEEEARTTSVLPGWLR